MEVGSITVDCTVGEGMREVGMTGRSGDMTKVGVVIGTGDMVSSTGGCRSVYVRGGYARTAVGVKSVVGSGSREL